MNEVVDLVKYFELRDRTLANNFAWLASFGCEIHRSDEIVHVTHPYIPEYNAYIVLGFSSKASKLFDSMLMNRKSRDLVYVDEAVNDSFSLDLARSNYRLEFLSQVKVANRTHVKTAGPIELRQAEPEELPCWSRLYSEGFARSGNLAVLDFQRWQMSSRDPAIQCWFFIDNGREVGVFQTCCRNNIIGLYSVTLLPSYRTLAKIIAAGRTLRSKLSFNYSNNVYFERVSARIPSQQKRAPIFRSFMTVRRFLIYKRNM